METFKEIVAIAETLSNVKKNVGGNAAMMALRVATEGAEVLLGASLGTKMRQHFPPSIKVAGHVRDGEHEDVHLLLEYAKGATWNGMTSPRANRYYVNHDIANAQLAALEEFDDALTPFKADVVVIGGLQLLEVDTNTTRRVERLRDLSTVLQSIYVQRIPMHLELAAASDFTLFHDMVNLVLPWINSIGLNEQELHILHHYLLTGEEAITAPSRPNVATVTGMMAALIKYSESSRKMSSKSLPLTTLDRIHFHTLPFHIICTRTDSPWGLSHNALVRSAYVSTLLACGDASTGKIKAQDIEVLLPRKIHIGADR